MPQLILGESNNQRCAAGAFNACVDRDGAAGGGPGVRTSRWNGGCATSYCAAAPASRTSTIRFPRTRPHVDVFQDQRIQLGSGAMRTSSSSDQPVWAKAFWVVTLRRKPAATNAKELPRRNPGGKATHNRERDEAVRDPSISKVYESQLSVVEKVLETAALMAGTDKSRG
jgi:hypothetical protein